MANKTIGQLTHEELAQLQTLLAQRGAVAELYLQAQRAQLQLIAEGTVAWNAFWGTIHERVPASKPHGQVDTDTGELYLVVPDGEVANDLTKVVDLQGQPLAQGGFALLGSSILPATVVLRDDVAVQFGDVVRAAQDRSGLDPDTWNALPEPAREELLAQEVELMRVALAPPDQQDHCLLIESGPEATSAGAATDAPADGAPRPDAGAEGPTTT